jgi:dihydroorotase
VDNLQAFVSGNAQRIHGYTPPKTTVTLQKTGMNVPEKYGDVVPYRAGETIPWGVAKVET